MTLLRGGAFFGVRSRERASGDFIIGVRDAEPHRVIRAHTHEDAHFILVLAGRYRTRARGVAQARGPLLIYNPPGTTHDDAFDAEAGRFVGRFASVALPRAALAGHPPLAEGTARCLLDPVAVGVAGALAHGLDRDALALEALALALVARVGDVPTVRERAAPRWVARAVARLLEDSGSEVTIAALAADAGVHPVYFVRAFRAWTGASPAALRRRHRVQLAVRMLTLGEASLSEVAMHCAFTDQSHLTRWIVRATGVTPSALRRAARVTAR
ncbi:MAG: helix-turn-helix transcriptional regulator [Gemmatimonadetes bacterium]|nr:helix-turn-helix transcriptional regulator [Gemmatimonadota bacterium]